MQPIAAALSVVALLPTLAASGSPMLAGGDDRTGVVELGGPSAG